MRLSYKEVGDVVGLDEETVRQRVRRLQERGVIARWSVGVHPALFGRRLVRLELPALTGPARAKAFEALCAMEGALHLFDFYGGRLALAFYGEAGAGFDRQLARIAALWAAPTTIVEMRLPPLSVEPTSSDWRVVAALRRDPRAPYAELVARAGLSERTVRRSVERLVEGRAVWLMPIVEMERAEGSIPVAVRVFFADPRERGVADERLKRLSGIVFAASHPDQTQVSYGARRLAEVDELRHELEGMPGVARVEVDIMIRRVTPDAWIDVFVARRIEGSRDA